MQLFSNCIGINFLYWNIHFIYNWKRLSLPTRNIVSRELYYISNKTLGVCSKLPILMRALASSHVALLLRLDFHLDSNYFFQFSLFTLQRQLFQKQQRSTNSREIMCLTVWEQTICTQPCYYFYFKQTQNYSQRTKLYESSLTADQINLIIYFIEIFCIRKIELSIWSGKELLARTR